MEYRNPKPVIVLIAPAGTGLIAIRRLVEPHVGSLALPGGYMECGQGWKEAAVREMQEETGLIYSVDEVKVANLPDFEPLFSTGDDRLLAFVQVPARDPASVAEFRSDETSEVVIVHAETKLAFPSHTAALNAYFASR